jgi:predicted permease
MSRLWRRVRAAVGRWRRPIESGRRLDAELHSYLEHDIDARIAAGLPPAEARRTALAAFGGLHSVAEQVRGARAGAWLEAVAQDVRYAWRSLRRSPGSATAVAGSLAIGMAGIVAGLALVNGWLFRPLAGVVEPHRLAWVDIERGLCGAGCWAFLRVTPDDHGVVQAALADVAQVAAASTLQVSIGTAEPQSVRARLVSTNYFDVLGTRPALGRWFVPEEGEASRALVAVIAHDLWVRDFQGSPGAVGRTLKVADRFVRIVGVAPPGFTGTSRRAGAERPVLWMPLALSESLPAASGVFFTVRNVRLLARPRAGVERSRFEAAAQVAAARIGAASEPGESSVRATFSDLQGRDAALRTAVIMAVPLLVLAVGCLNAANLLLARGSERRRELVVRLALGAARSRIVRQQSIEGLMLATASVLAGLLLAWSGIRLAAANAVVETTFDGRVMLVAVAVAYLCGGVVGVLPALRATAPRALGGIGLGREGVSGSPVESRGRRTLVVVQIAASIGLLVFGMQMLAQVEAIGAAGTPGRRLLLASFDLAQLEYEPARADAFYEQLAAHVSRLPGVESVGLARRTAVWTFGQGVGPASLIVRPFSSQEGTRAIVGGYAGGALFDALGLRVVEGRGFVPADREGTPRVAVINRRLADMLAGPAVGQLLRVGSLVLGRPDAEATAIFERDAVDVRVVGIIESTHEPLYTRDDQPAPKVYVPAPLGPEPALTLYVRTRGDAEAAAPALRRVVRQIDSAVPIVELGSLDRVNERSFGPLPLLVRTAALLGLLALLLAAAGLYALVTYAVSMRTREFAVRLALGARPGRLVTLVLRQAMTLVAAGLAAGGVLSIGLTPLALDEISDGGLDVLALAESVALLVLAMFAASIHPALRAARVDPVANLKDA